LTSTSPISPVEEHLFCTQACDPENILLSVLGIDTLFHKDIECGVFRDLKPRAICQGLEFVVLQVFQDIEPGLADPSIAERPRTVD
jgi:hypothetical protein